MNSLDVLPLKDIQQNNNGDEHQQFQMNPILMGCSGRVFKPFLCSIVAPVRSGKSVLINNLLLNPNFGYKNLFEKIYLISPTIMNDESGRFLKDDDDIIKLTDNLDNIDGIIQAIATLQDEEGDEKGNVLLVLDDCLGFLRKQNGFFNNFMSRYRHYKISIIITSQHFKALSVIQRINSGYWILFNTFNAKEKKAIDEEMSGSIPNFLKLWTETTKRKYTFLYIDMEQMKAYQNFNELVWSKDNEYNDENQNEKLNQD